jgi:hypothetical protein
VTKSAWIAALLLLAACGGSQSATVTSPTPRTPGPLGDTWTWTGTAWHLASSGGPAPRYLAALAYDAPRHVFVLFGGQTKTATSDETWTWDGAKWKAMSPAHKPPPRRGAAMAYDPTHQVVVLYGGLVPDQAEGFDASDTWTWDGSDWTLVSAKAEATGPREGARMLTAGGRALLFGGRAYNVQYYGDAWTWDSKTWSRVDRSPTPPGRAHAAVAWDPVDSSLVIFGGSGLNSTGGPGEQGTPLSDAWSLTGGKWTQLSSEGPGRLEFASAMWDGKKFVVLLGMPCPNPSSDAWGWDGKSWLKLASPGISARYGAALAPTPDGKALLFGGSDERGC